MCVYNPGNVTPLIPLLVAWCCSCWCPFVRWFVSLHTPFATSVNTLLVGNNHHPCKDFSAAKKPTDFPLSKSARSCYVIFCIVLYVFFIVCCLSCSVCVVVYIICILLYLSLFPSVQCSSRQFSGVGFSPLFEVSPVFQLFVDHKISVQSSFSVGLMSRPVKLYLSVQSDSCIFV